MIPIVLARMDRFRSHLIMRRPMKIVTVVSAHKPFRQIRTLDLHQAAAAVRVRPCVYFCKRTIYARSAVADHVASPPSPFALLVDLVSWIVLHFSFQAVIAASIVGHGRANARARAMCLLAAEFNRPSLPLQFLSYFFVCRLRSKRGQ